MHKIFTKDFGIIAIGAILGFIGWMFLQYGAWRYIQTTFHSTASFWVVVGALSQALTGATIAIGAFVAYRELSEAEKSRHIDIADRLFDELNSEENIKARRWIFQNLEGDPATKLKIMSQDDKEMIKRVLNSLDRVSFLTQKGWIDDDVVMPWMHPMISKSWEKLRPYVKYERQRRNEDYYYAQAEILADRCHNWRVKNNLDPETTRVDGAI